MTFRSDLSRAETASRPQPEAIDWRQLRRQLAQASLATEEATRFSPERARAVLEERRRLLARVPPAPTAAGEMLQVVVFCLGEERYALQTDFVREVVRLRDYAPLPGAPAFVLGILNLRGEILSVLDLRPFCGAAQRAPSDRSRVLVVGGDRSEFGLLADDVLAVAAVRRDEILEPPASVGGRREHLLGVTEQALIVLDGTALLRDGRLFVDQGGEG